MRAVTLRPRRVQRPFREGGDTGVGDGDDVKLLLVEDDDKIAGAVRRGLAAEGYTVDVAPNGDDGLWMATEGAYDLILLDIMLPRRSGYRVCADLRAAGDWTPILMLTAKDGDLDEAEALDTGADDYLVKPFSFAVLVARVRALLRRAPDRGPAPVSVGDLRMDAAQRRVWRRDRELTLTAREFAVLELLVRRSGQVLSKDDILAGVWEHAFEGDPNIVEVYVRRLRRKIDEPFDRQSIETVRGAGYRLVG
jgi:two-component system OmpR family response regulator